MWQRCLSWGDDPGCGLNSESKVQAGHVSGPELRPWLARWCDSRGTWSMLELPVQTGDWLPACWCLIVRSCWFCSLTRNGVEVLFINCKSLCNISCRHLGLGRSAARLPPVPTHMDLRGAVECKWCTAVQPVPWPRQGENRACL